jgi:hypothetical protein
MRGTPYGVQLWSANPDGSTRWVLGSTADDHLNADTLGVSPDNEVLVAGGWTWNGAMNMGWFRGYDPADGTLLWQVDLAPEQGLPQFARTVRPAFSHNADTAYVTSWFAGDGVGHSYLYAIALKERPGDVDSDGDVDLDDLTMVLADFGCKSPPPPDCAGDVNGDGDVDLSDLTLLLQNFGLGT